MQVRNAMPIYVYRCSEGHELEVISLTHNDYNVVVCTKCSPKRPMRRVDFNRTGTPQMYGAGFYKPSVRE
jgi:predicted nucleic acid-binding Zn ribbon protein